MLGIFTGIIELGIYFGASYLLRLYSKPLQDINIISYYWFTMTVLTMIWEASFVSQYKSVNDLSRSLISNNTHVWTNDYDISYILPWKLSKIFYAEYGAYADREYMITSDNWSRIIESTHALFCGLFAMLALNYKTRHINNKYLIAGSISMGSQLMNSVLYMANYCIELRDKDNVNYITPQFPAGPFLINRWFMYVNIFWTLMPLLTIIIFLSKNYGSINKQL